MRSLTCSFKNKYHGNFTAMKLVKPAWVDHDALPLSKPNSLETRELFGKPIFSVDVHPDGSRFATGGQGDDCGIIVIWNMLPVRSEKVEQDDKIPKLLCKMDNHQGCVNCVRWSHDGRYLASVGDDKLVMTWQISRYGSSSTVFGSEGTIVNHEHWRVANVLRGHAEDVLDVAWSPHDAWLASCSVDNNIIVWNALKLPEQVAVLRGHSGLVKGVTWDPVGKYLASQSDDKTLRVWRTSDWKQEACIKEPFQECCGTTHVLRLNWSPDGHYIVSAHAMNNSGPTAQIIERDDWKTTLDFVGHRKAVTCVRFNPNLFRKKIKKNRETEQQYSCVAIGSRDRTVSIWLTALKRPLVLTHDLFESSILDLSWSRSGLELLTCSADGTVAYMSFSVEELGTPISKKDKETLFRKIYGSSVLSAKSTPSNTQQVIETTAMLNIQQKKEEEKNKVVGLPKSSFETPKKQNINSNASCPSTPATPSNKQIETRTKDGKRRITPIFLSAPPDVGEIPKPFHSSVEPMFSSSKEQSTIIREKVDSLSPPVLNLTSQSRSPTSAPSATANQTTEHKPSPVRSNESNISPASHAKSASQAVPKIPPTTMPGQTAPMPSASTSNSVAAKSKPDKVIVHTAKRKLDTDAPTAAAAATQEPPAKKKDGRGRPRKDKTIDTPTRVTTVQAQLPPQVVEKETKIIYTNSGLDLAVPSILKTAHVQVYGAQGAGNGLFVNIENHVSVGTVKLHVLQGVRGGQTVWESMLNSPILACTGNKHFICAACLDKTVHLLSAQSGSRLLPALVLDAKVHKLRSSGQYVMAITSRGTIYVWNMKSKQSVIKNESLASIVMDDTVKVVNTLLTEQGLPVISLSTGSTYTYKQELGCWVVLSSKDDVLHSCSDHHGFMPSSSAQRTGPLATLQAAYKRERGGAGRVYHGGAMAQQQCATLSHLESQVANCLALQSSSEYQFWLLTYVRYLVQEGMESRLREVCDDFIGPMHKSKSAVWQPHVLGHSKRKLLEDCLPVIGSNLQLQRIYTEYKEQLDSVK